MTAPTTTTTLNTDPSASPAFVSIAQDPTKSPGWNVVTLADGTVAKFAGFGQRKLPDNTIIQYIILNTPDLQDEFAGPIITPEIAKAIEAVGGVLPPIEAPVTLKPDPTPAPTPAAPTSPFTLQPPSTPPVPEAAQPEEPTGESILQRIEELGRRLEHGLVADTKGIGRELGSIVATIRKHL